MSTQHYSESLVNSSFMFLAVLMFISTLILNPINMSSNTNKILPPPEGIENVSFGFELAMADLLWLGYIQNNWTCSKYEDPNDEICPQRWAYRTLKSATDLDPRYRVIGSLGATNLTIIQDDHLGAEELFLKLLKTYPNDWVMNYRLAYVYLDDLKNDEKAAKHLEIAANNGAPLWAKSLASKLYSKSGKKKLSYTVLMQLYKEADNEDMKKSLEPRIAALVSEIAELEKTDINKE